MSEPAIHGSGNTRSSGHRRFTLFASAVVVFANATPTPAQDTRPNLVLILADDMGYTDLGCYGGEIETPVLDRLAAGGVRFTQFYNTSRCCPTRASLLTGLYSHQTGIGLMTGDRGYDAYRGDLNRRCVTLAEVLRAAGYGTLLSGKWHVTKHTGANSDRRNWPLQRGFERFYGTIIGAGSFFDPATLCRGNTFITPENDPEYRPKRFYYTDAITDNAITFLREHSEARPDDPFFLYLSYTCAHWPLHALEAECQKYRGRYDAGFDAIRQARLHRARELGVLDPGWELSPAPVDWRTVANREWELRNMEVYAAMVDRMDQGIGRLVAELERQGVLANTVILYLQDNGGCAEGYGRRSNADQADQHDFTPFGPDDLQPAIWPPMQTRDGRWVRTGPEVVAGDEDTFVAYGTGWANVSNTPFRGYKHDAYEGGIATPFLVHWPSGIDPARRGSVVEDPCHLIDLMPTFVALAGATYPEASAEESILPMEGVDLAPCLEGRALRRTAPLCFEHHGNLALREGRWKVVSQYRANSPRRWELYDMEQDRTELRDLATEQPERRDALVAKWERWAARVGVQNWPFQSRDE